MTASDLNIHGANAEEIFKQFKNAIFRIGINTSKDAKIADERIKTAFTAFVNKAKDGQIYEGYVVHKFDNNTYILNASVKGVNEFKLKKFTLDNIKQIKNK